MFSKKLTERIDNVVKQFLCNVPIQTFIWDNIFEDLAYDSQEILTNRTVNSSLVTNYQIEINYQKSFLKYLIQKLEKQNLEVHDDMYSAYGRLVALPSRNEYFKHYSIKDGRNTITLKENVHLISEGTTGLRTWQAALVLSEWSLLNAQTFNEKTVLELGSGVGLTGLTIGMECLPSCIYLTDCHTSVLNTLSDNVKLNMENNTTTDDCDTSDALGTLEMLRDRCVCHSLGKSNVLVLRLPWEDINQENCGKLGTINRVVAADVVYDCELFDSLIGALKCLASVCSVDEFIFSCTERNKTTLDDFLSRMRDASFVIEELQIPPQHNFIWPMDTPIRLLRFTMKQLCF